MTHLLTILGHGFREAALMVWMTLWPLVLGFTLSGVVQAFVPKDRLTALLGRTSPRAAARASLLGVVSSSCSYAASAMARALFFRGASFTNATVFMVASTNLVVELGVVLFVLLGWQFLVAEFVGGLVMIITLVLLGRVLDRGTLALRPADTGDGGGTEQSPAATWRYRAGWQRAAGFTMGDLTMLRNELVLGFVVAGFLAATVPNAAWSAIFLTHHGWLTTAENVLVAPLVAVASFVCSVGNIPLAAALWLKGVSFGGVVAFVFADLVTLPLLLIYRRFYGRAVALKLFVVLWFTMSVAGAVTEVIFRAVGATPRRGASVAMGSHFALGSTLVVNLLSLVVLTITYWISRGATSDDSVAIDPVCGMQVSRVSAAATVTHDGVTYYFCAPRCAERFSAAPTKFLSDPATMREDVNGDFVDPVCQMRVSAETAAGVVEGPDGPVYFCSLGCRDRYLAGPTAAPGTAVVQLGKKPRA